MTSTRKVTICLISANLAAVFILSLCGLTGAAELVDCNDVAQANHTYCKYNRSAPGVIQTKKSLSRVEEQILLVEHNKARSNVACGREAQGSTGPQPGAKDMTDITWDQNLAIVAQRWANQCKIGFDQYRTIEPYASVGQNIFGYIEPLSSANLNDPYSAINSPCSKAVPAWYAQVARFNSANIKPFVFSSSAGQYSQLLWANSVAFGCGSSQWIANNKMNAVCVCNYGEAGNRQNGIMYTPASDRSEVCSNCPPGRFCDDSCLCITPNANQDPSTITRSSS